MILNDRKVFPLHGIKFWAEKKDDLLIQLLSDLAGGESGLLVTPNLSFLYQCGISPQLNELIKNSRFITCDSKYIAFLNKLAFRTRLPVLTGSSLIYELLALAEFKQIPIGVIGGALASEEIMQCLIKIYPKLSISFCYSDFIDENDSSAIREVATQIKETEARLVFVGLGFPKQEWISTRLLENGASGLYVNIGMGLNYLLKTQRRAPKVIQFFALEWLWRVFVEPKRLARRYFLECLPEFMAQLRIALDWRIR